MAAMSNSKEFLSKEKNIIKSFEAAIDPHIAITLKHFLKSSSAFGID